MKTKYIIAILVSLALITALIFSFSLYKTQIGKQMNNHENLIGGQTDEHGCLGPAGYSWNDDANACIRNWELNDEQKNASRIAIAHLNFPVTIIEANKLDGIGNYALKIQRNDNREIINLEISNWKLVN